MNIRVAGRSDIRSIFDIRTSVVENHMSVERLQAVGITPESIADMLDRDARAWVASIAGVDAAFAMANSTGATVFAMFVRPEYEGRGLGRALMTEVVRWLCIRGCEEIWLVTDGNHAIRAHGFYKRLGWTDVGVQPDGQIKYVLSCRDPVPVRL